MKKILTAAIVLLGIVAFSLPVQALQLDFNTVFSQGTAGVNPSGPTPWATATFTGSGSVTLTITSSMTTASQFISEMSFNLDPNLDPTKLVFTPGAISGAASPTISTGVNAFQADGDGKFDILLAFDTSGGPGNGRFDGINSVTYTITSTEAGLTANSFNFLSAPGGGNGSWSGAAHIQGVPNPAGGTTSDWVGPGTGVQVPEPATMLLLGLGLLGLGIAVRKRS